MNNENTADVLPNAEENLVRGISRWDLVAITINSIIGAGIFGLPSKAAALIGSYSLFAFAACALVVAFIVLCFAEVASRFKATGGSYLYAREAFGSIVGFEVGWLFWLVRVTAFATNCIAFVEYLSFFFPSVTGNLMIRGTIIFLVVAALAAVNFIGIRESAQMTNFFTAGKLLTLLAFVAVGMFFVNSVNFSFQQTPATTDFSKAVLILIYAFTGFEMAVIPAGEMKNPQKNLPFALLTAVGIVAAVYILIQFVCVGTMPELADSTKPLADSASRFMGTFGAGFVTIGALISIFGNLNSLLLSASRVPFAMAEKGELPQILAKTHARFKTPVLSIFLTAAAMFLLSLNTSFLQALTLSVTTRLLVYASTCASLPIFRRRQNAPRAEFFAPFGIFAAAASLALILWLLSNVAAKDFVQMLIAAAVGLVFFFANKLFKRKSDLPNNSG